MKEPRRFTDAHGVEWNVFEGVTPGRRAVVMRPAGSEAFARVRRWLAFENETERRRLEPAPWGWQDAPVAELIRLLDLATPILKRLRLPGDPDSA